MTTQQNMLSQRVFLPNFIKISTDFFLCSWLTPKQKETIEIFEFFRIKNSNNILSLSKHDVESFFGLSYNTFKKRCQELCDLGLIKISHRVDARYGNLPNEYKLLYNSSVWKIKVDGSSDIENENIKKKIKEVIQSAKTNIAEKKQYVKVYLKQIQLLSTKSNILLSIISCFKNGDNISFPSERRIAELLGVKLISDISVIVNKLKKCGIFDIEKAKAKGSKYSHNVYKINLTVDSLEEMEAEENKEKESRSKVKQKTLSRKKLSELFARNTNLRDKECFKSKKSNNYRNTLSKCDDSQISDKPNLIDIFYNGGHFGSKNLRIAYEYDDLCLTYPSLKNQADMLISKFYILLMDKNQADIFIHGKMYSIDILRRIILSLNQSGFISIIQYFNEHNRLISSVELPMLCEVVFAIHEKQQLLNELSENEKYI